MLLPDNEVLSGVLEQLFDIPDVQASVIQATPMSADAGADALLEIRSGDSPPLILQANVKRHLRPPMVGVIRAQLAASASEHPPILVSDYVSPPIAEQLDELGIMYVDAAGNAHIRGPGVYIHIAGRSSVTRRTRRSLTPARSRVLFSLLRDPTIRHRDYRSIAAASGVSVGTVSGAIKALAALGLVQAAASRIRIPDFEAAVSQWDISYASQVRSSLNPARFSRSNVRPAQWSRDELAEAGVLAGGELGFSWALGGLRPLGAALHSQHSPREVSRLLRLIPDPDGDIVHLEPLSADDSSVDWPGVVDPLLLRSELLTLGDPRLDEAADRLMNEAILPRERGADRG